MREVEVMTTNVMESPTATVDDVLSGVRGVRDAIAVQRVFGEPYEIGDVTIIPVARVAGGGGGGGAKGGVEESAETGFGSGFGMETRPVGVYEVRGDDVAWKPVVDATRIVRGGQVLAGIGLICVTLVLLRRSR